MDGTISTCMRTEPIGLSSPDKTVWWMVDLGGIYNIYSVNILFKNYEELGMQQQISFVFVYLTSLCVIVSNGIITRLR